MVLLDVVSECDVKPVRFWLPIVGDDDVASFPKALDVSRNRSAGALRLIHQLRNCLGWSIERLNDSSR